VAGTCGSNPNFLILGPSMRRNSRPATVLDSGGSMNRRFTSLFVASFLRVLATGSSRDQGTDPGKPSSLLVTGLNAGKQTHRFVLILLHKGEWDADDESTAFDEVLQDNSIHACSSRKHLCRRRPRSGEGGSDTLLSGGSSVHHVRFNNSHCRGLQRGRFNFWTHHCIAATNLGRGQNVCGPCEKYGRSTSDGSGSHYTLLFVDCFKSAPDSYLSRA
jgi:hypothetical protein